MIKVNLIPVKERKKIKGLNELTLGVIAILAVFILLVALQLWRIKEIKDVNNKSADTKARILKLEDVKKKVEKPGRILQDAPKRSRGTKTCQVSILLKLYVMEAL